ncbi:MAG: hypothetical protein ACI306_09005 [Muribaculaceae bacterium]
MFTHSHRYADNTIVHSHPYLPSSHHSHSAQDYGAISWYNAAMLAVKAEASLQPTVPAMTVTVIAEVAVAMETYAKESVCAWRAPPCV